MVSIRETDPIHCAKSQPADIDEMTEGSAQLCVSPDFDDRFVAADPSRKLLKVLRWITPERAFPNDSDTPAIGGQFRNRPFVPRLIGTELLIPELLACLRQAEEWTAFMPVPKTPMDENDGSPLRQDNVRLSGEFRSMKPIAEALPPKVLPYLQLRPGVLRPDS